MKNQIGQIVRMLTHAYQPIVNIHTGTVIGFEALLRNFLESGFESIDAVFDFAYSNDNLFMLDINLRKKAIKKLTDNKLLRSEVMLFYNLDNRILTSKDYEYGKTMEILNEFNISPSNVCFEISEKYYLECSEYVIKLLNNYKNQGFKVALDDFGAKFSGLEYLYYFEPDYVKIDRFFIDDINKNYKKRLFVEHMANLCLKLGIKIIAEGAETLQEIKECKEMGFNLVQGYFVEKPQTNLSALKLNYEHLKEIKSARDKTDRNLILEHLKLVEPVNVNDSVINCLHRFNNTDVSLLPVVDDKMQPLGIVTEKDLRNYAYSPYGKDLLKNKIHSKRILAITKKAPIVCINSKIEHVIENLIKTNNYNETDVLPVLITEFNKYIGYLDAQTIINIIHKQNLVRVANQNPLTKLPGNNLIANYIQDALLNAKPTAFVYFDIDNFKAYNDTFGFRQGDRLILFLSDLLQKNFSEKNYFVGHIGGDDFFVGCGLSNNNFEEVLEKCKKAQNDFNDGSRVFYSKEIIDQGYIQAKDRDGVIKNFDFASISFAILCSTQKDYKPSEEKISILLASLKKQAKSLRAFCAATIMNQNNHILHI